jgi:hypothetical protein
MSEENQVIDAEEVVEPAKVVLDNVDYMVADMDQQSQYLFAQVKDLEQKRGEAEKAIFQAQFSADQIVMASQAFQAQLADRLKNPKPAETEIEAKE